MPAVRKEREWFDDLRKNDPEKPVTRIYPRPPPSPMRSFPAPWSVIQPPNIHNDSRAQAESRRDIEEEHDFSFPVPPTFRLISRRDNTSSEVHTSGTGDPSSSSQPMGIPSPFGGPVVKSSYCRPAETLTKIRENTDNQHAEEEEHDQNPNTEAQVRQADPGVVVSEGLNHIDVSHPQRDW